MIRFFDIVFSLLGLILLLPFFVIIAACICIESKGGAFYKQLRVGKNSRDFFLYKFRSMYIGSDKKGLLTIGKDSRVSRCGRFIRKYKIDELPQLFNVLKGDMSLVGPRPEVRKYVDLYSEAEKKVLSIRPGITDLASIEFIDENSILAKSLEPEKTYIEEVMPQKLRLNMEFVENYNLKNYFRIIFKTIFRIVRG